MIKIKCRITETQDEDIKSFIVEDKQENEVVNASWAMSGNSEDGYYFEGNPTIDYTYIDEERAKEFISKNFNNNYAVIEMTREEAIDYIEHEVMLYVDNPFDVSEMTDEQMQDFLDKYENEEDE